MVDEKPHLIWKERSREHIYDAGVFNLEKAERESADGRRGSFVLLSSPDWVQVVATTVDSSSGKEFFVLVHQYRQGAQQLTVELPGGLVDEAEEPEAAARRELEEETGYRAAELIPIGRVSPNPAIMDNTAHTFVAPNARQVTGQRLDANEILDAELVPVEELDPTRHPEFFVHAIMVSAMYWYEKWKANQP